MTIFMELTAAKKATLFSLPRARVAALCGTFMAKYLAPGKIEKTLTKLSKFGVEATQDEAKTAWEDILAVSGRARGENCLPRSISIFLLLFLRRKSCTWKSGVCHAPFAAHAWIEVGGIPVGETLDITRFLVIATTEETNDWNKNEE